MRTGYSVLKPVLGNSFPPASLHFIKASQPSQKTSMAKDQLLKHMSLWGALCLCNVTSMHVFRAIWHWTTNWCALPWRRPPLLLPAFPQLLSFYVGRRTGGLFPTHSGTLVHTDETLWVLLLKLIGSVHISVSPLAGVSLLLPCCWSLKHLQSLRLS